MRVTVCVLHMRRSEDCELHPKLPGLVANAFHSQVLSPSLPLSLSILPGKKDTKTRETAQWVNCLPHRRGNPGLGPQLGEGHTVGGRSNQVDARTG